MHKVSTRFALPGATLMLVASAALAQPNQPNRLPNERLGEQPTVEERIVEEQVIAEKAAQEVAAGVEIEKLDAELQAGEIAPDDGELAQQDATLNDGSPPPNTHATSPAPPELVALAAREPERFLGKIVVLVDGVNKVTVGPVLALRKRVLDQEPYLIVDATAYFKAPTQYAVAVRDLDHIESNRLIMPEADGMHLRGLEYYEEDYTALESTAPEDVLAKQEEGEEAAEAAEDAADTSATGEVEIRRF